MRKTILLALIVALDGGGLGASAAQAGGPVVIAGVGPDVAVAGPAQRPMRMATAGGGLGGGFIEMLVSGGSSASGGERRGQAETAPLQAAPRMAPVQRAYVDPQPQPQEPHAPPAQAGVRRAIEPRFLRQEVDYEGSHAPGSIVVDTPNRYLYYVLGSGRALRYGIGVGRPGFEWAGVKTVSRKAEWPGWTPPPEMLLRRPDLPRHMDGGPENPLGARAMYLGSSMYRIHGTNEPWTIGQNVSSGCIRMMNEDVMDLYERVKVGTKVQVI